MHKLGQRARSEERGIAMIMAIGVLLIASILIAVMFETVLREQVSTARERNITNGRQAAEAGIDKAIYELGQSSNWSDYLTNYPCTNGTTGCYTGTIGRGSYTGSIKTSPLGSNYHTITMRGTFAGQTNDKRVIQVTVSKIPPPALSYAMFASRGIDIHHHSASWLSPQVWTTSVHSNGYMKIDYSAEFTLQNLEVVGLLQFQNGGGQDPGGAIPASGYNWLDPLNQKCYPGVYPTTTAGVAPVGGICSSANMYSGNAVITGNIAAGSVKQGTRGIVAGGPNIHLLTGLDLGSRNGDILTGRYQGPTGNPLLLSTDVCSNCNKGSGVGPGQVAGNITIQPGYTPPVIPFPVLQYPNYKNASATEIDSQTGAHHEYSSCANFISAATSTTKWFRVVDTTTGDLKAWNPGMGLPDAIQIGGYNGAADPANIYIDSGSCDFEWNAIESAVATTACTGAAQRGCSGNHTAAATAWAPLLLIKGSLVVPGGGISNHAPVAIVGADNPTNFITRPDGSTSPPTPLGIDDTKFLGTATLPGVMAAGGAIDSHDYDDDSKWTSSTTYEWWKASPVYVRGLVYSAAYVNATTATPANQHFHNDDPKNLIKVFGSQIGAVLHNCMNFTFTYDPIVENTPFVTSPGTVKVTDYRELQPSASL